MGGPASLLDAQASTILFLAAALATFSNDHITDALVVDGGISQSSGANTPPTMDVDIGASLDCKVDGIAVDVAAQTALSTIEGDALAWGADSGVSAIVAVVVDGVGTGHLVAGAPAATGSQVAPTAAEIVAAVGGPAVTAAHILLTRTGATAITAAVSHAGARPTMPKITDIATDNAAFTSGGFVRTHSPVPNEAPSA